MLSGLITSKIRIRILMRLFHNPEHNAYVRELSDEFGATPSHVKSELDQLSEAGLLTRKMSGRQVFFSANRQHPLFVELQSMVRKALGMDRVVGSMIARLGNLERAYLVDDYAKGKDSGIIDLVLVGDIDQYHLNDLTQKTERYIKRKVRSMVLDKNEFTNLQANLRERDMMLLWEKSNDGN